MSKVSARFNFTRDRPNTPESLMKSQQRKYNTLTYNVGTSTSNTTLTLDEDADGHGPSVLSSLVFSNKNTSDVTYLITVMACVQGNCFTMYDKVPVRSETKFVAISASNPFYFDGYQSGPTQYIQYRVNSQNPFNYTLTSAGCQVTATTDRWYID